MIEIVLMMIPHIISTREIAQIQRGRQLICMINPEQITSHGKPIDSISRKGYPEFTLSMDEEGSPIEIKPRNLVENRSDLIHLTRGVPRMKDKLVVMDISYEHPLIVIPPTKPGTPPITMGRLLTVGKVKVDPMYLRFTIEQTLKMDLNLKISETSRQDLHVEAKGTCVERALSKIVSDT